MELQKLHQDLTPPVSDMHHLIDQHNRTVALVEQGLALLTEAISTCPGQYGIQGALDHVRWYSDNVAQRNTPDVKMAVQRATWRALVDTSRLTTVMAASDVEKLKEQIAKDCPEITPETVVSTFVQLYKDRDKSYRRGLVELFQNLCRTYKSNKAFKIGKRIILDNAMSENGWNSFNTDEARSNDLMRIFMLTAGKDPGKLPRDEQFSNALSVARRTDQSDYENEYFLAKLYKNGNVHIFFKRQDLVDKINQLIADEYGHALPDDRQVRTA